MNLFLMNLFQICLISGDIMYVTSRAVAVKDIKSNRKILWLPFQIYGILEAIDTTCNKRHINQSPTPR